ncbi:MAG: hypothetical protein COA32_09385 [Fluviicola sp.]|nr:MAG: hypothetical protein COA32_09385 [Fluviicola sp.]
MKSFLCLFVLTSLMLLLSCNSTDNLKQKKRNVNQVMDSWHESAAEAEYEDYFNAMNEKSIFIGTDAGENWTKEEFQSFSKPYFDKGKAWSFKALERNIYFSQSGRVAWFDELLNTWMGTCRGSGVLERTNNTWKIKHYVLSVCIPNEDMQEVIVVKSLNDSLFRAK